MRQIFFALCLLLMGCGTGRITSTQTRPNEAIVFGKMRIEGNLPMTHSKVLIHFNERLWGSHVVWLDEEGYFYTKLPLGTNDIALLEYRKEANFFANIPKGYATVDIAEANKIYYVGDITVEWTPYHSGVRSSKGIAGALAEANQTEEALPFSVTSNEDSMAYFRARFPDADKEIVVSFLKVE